MGTLDERRRWIADHGRDMTCPYCGSNETERSAEFGPFHMSETYVCRECRSPFSRIKWGDGSEDTSRG